MVFVTDWLCFRDIRTGRTHWWQQRALLEEKFKKGKLGCVETAEVAMHRN
jgi:hypothetical protein